MAVSDKEMKKLVRLTADVRNARKNLERATKARSAISAELFRLQEENMSGADPTTHQQNCERMNVLRDQYQQITDGTFAYSKDGPDFGKYVYTWGSFRVLRSFIVLFAWLLVAIIAWAIFS